MAQIITINNNEYQTIHLKKAFKNSIHNIDIVFSAESLYSQIKQKKYDIIILDLYIYNSNIFLTEDSLRIIKAIKESGSFEGKFLLCVEFNHDYRPSLNEHADYVVKDSNNTNNIIVAIEEMCKESKQLIKKLNM